MLYSCRRTYAQGLLYYGDGTVVWYGVVWCSAVCFGVVWCGMVWPLKLIVWFGVVWCAVLCCAVPQHSTPYHTTARQTTPHHITAHHTTPQHITPYHYNILYYLIIMRMHEYTMVPLYSTTRLDYDISILLYYYITIILYCPLLWWCCGMEWCGVTLRFVVWWCGGVLYCAALCYVVLCSTAQHTTHHTISFQYIIL